MRARWSVLAAVLGCTADAAPPPPPAGVPPPSADVDRTVDLLCGAAPASFGSAFASVELGKMVAQLPSAPARAGLATVTLLTTGHRVDGVDLDVPWDPGWADCYNFSAKLHARWGSGDEVTDGYETWHDAAHDRAATFTHRFTDCELAFTRAVTPEEWLNDKRSSLVPIWAIGKPVTELEAALGLSAGSDASILEWTDESGGDRFLTVKLTAHAKRGRVVGLVVAPAFDSPVAEVLWQRLKAMYGAPDVVKGFEDALTVTWRRAPGIEVAKYWGHDAIAPVPHVRGGPAAAPPPPARAATADDGVVTSIHFGS